MSPFGEVTQVLRRGHTIEDPYGPPGMDRGGSKPSLRTTAMRAMNRSRHQHGAGFVSHSSSLSTKYLQLLPTRLAEITPRIDVLTNPICTHLLHCYVRGEIFIENDPDESAAALIDSDDETSAAASVCAAIGTAFNASMSSGSEEGSVSTNPMESQNWCGAPDCPAPRGKDGTGVRIGFRSAGVDRYRRPGFICKLPDNATGTDAGSAPCCQS
jgi:hypothetical protein